MIDIISKLQGGDRRSIGRSEEVVADVLGEPSLFDALVGGMPDPDPVVRMRAADAVEKVTRIRPGWLTPYRRLIVDQIALVEQQEVRWHVAQVIPRLELSRSDVPQVKAILMGYLDDSSRIVQVEAMQALAYLVELWPGLRREVRDLIRGLIETGSPALRSRGRKLLARLALPPTCGGQDPAGEQNA